MGPRADRDSLAKEKNPLPAPVAQLVTVLTELALLRLRQEQSNGSIRMDLQVHR